LTFAVKAQAVPNGDSKGRARGQHGQERDCCDCERREKPARAATAKYSFTPSKKRFESGQTKLARKRSDRTIRPRAAYESVKDRGRLRPCQPLRLDRRIAFRFKGFRTGNGRRFKRYEARQFLFPMRTMRWPGRRVATEKDHRDRCAERRLYRDGDCTARPDLRKP
jgi:hypothetical protein